MSKTTLHCTHSLISHATIYPLCDAMPSWRKAAHVAAITFTLYQVYHNPKKALLTVCSICAAPFKILCLFYNLIFKPPTAFKKEREDTKKNGKGVKDFSAEDAAPQKTDTASTDSTPSTPNLASFEIIFDCTIPSSSNSSTKATTSNPVSDKAMIKVRQKCLNFCTEKSVPMKNKAVDRLSQYSHFLLTELHKKICASEPKSLGSRNVAEDAYHLLEALFTLGMQTWIEYKNKTERVETLVNYSRNFSNYYHAFQQGALVASSSSHVYTFSSPKSDTSKSDMNPKNDDDATALFNHFIGALSEFKDIPEIANLLNDPKFQRRDRSS